MAEIPDRSWLVRDASGQRLGIVVETLFLVNLMILPVIGFLLIALLYLVYRGRAPLLAKNHLRQTFFTSLFGGALLVSITGLIALIGGMDSGYTWIAVVLYFTLVHTSLILFGAIGLSKALTGKPVCYPLIGRFFLRDDDRRLCQRQP